jgi:hypothetical protein
VLPIYKSDDKRKCENYRPISILPIISKIFERCVFNQVYTYLNENTLLSKYQAGFRPKNSTLSALIQMCDDCYANIRLRAIPLENRGIAALTNCQACLIKLRLLVYISKQGQKHLLKGAVSNDSISQFA